MKIEQHYLQCLAQASYVIEDGGEIAIVDPRRDVDLYLERAEALGGTIRHVLLTHFHADFLAGHLELVRRTDATLYLGQAARPDYAHTPLDHGDRIQLGDLSIECLETPGHTPESVCYLALEHDEPRAVLTGDTLFIGDVGRPDLMSAEGLTPEDLAAQLYDSLRDVLLKLPDATIVYPGHGAGSPCGKALSSETVSTIGEQRAQNYALQPMSKPEFVQQLVQGLPAAPAYFPLTARLNRESHSVLEDVLEHELVAMTLDDVLTARSDGAQLLDTRERDAFAAGHLPGSINIGPDGMFASWAGRCLDLDRPIVLVAEAGEERMAATRLGRIGLDRVAGFLEGGPSSFGDAPLDTVERATPAEAEAAIAAGARLLDVRQPGELEQRAIEGAVAIPLGELEARMNELPSDVRLYVICKGGYRSMTAASILQRAGHSRVVDIVGGCDAWDSDGCALVRPQVTT